LASVHSLDDRDPCEHPSTSFVRSSWYSSWC